MSFFNDLIASIKIFISNFTAAYGATINFLFWLIIFALIVAFIRRSAVFIIRSKKIRSSIEIPQAPKELCDHAEQSLSQAIKIQTISGDANGIRKFKGFLKERYPEIFKAMDCIDMSSGGLILRWRGVSDKSPVLFCAHMDVVPVEGQLWQGAPFSGKIDNGFIHGRGALDCKNVLTGVLEAATSLISEDFQPTRDIYFAFGSDEETGGKNGASAIAEIFKQKNISFDFIIDEGGNITSSHLGSKDFPAALIGVCEKGSASYRICAQTHAGHSAMPPEHTALGILCEAVCRIESAPMHKRLLPVMKRCLKYSAPALNFAAQSLIANLPYTKHMLFHFTRHNLQLSSLFHTTFAATQASGSNAANVLPESADAVINVRLLQGDTSETVLEYFKSLLADLPVNVEILSANEPSEITQVDGAAFTTVSSTVTETFGKLACIPVIMPAGTDTKHYQDLSKNILRFMPFITDSETFATIHSADERISCESLNSGILFYKNLMKKI